MQQVKVFRLRQDSDDSDPDIPPGWYCQIGEHTWNAEPPIKGPFSTATEALAYAKREVELLQWDRE